MSGKSIALFKKRGFFWLFVIEGVEEVEEPKEVEMNQDTKIATLAVIQEDHIVAKTVVSKQWGIVTCLEKPVYVEDKQSQKEKFS